MWERICWHSQSLADQPCQFMSRHYTISWLNHVAKFLLTLTYMSPFNIAMIFKFYPPTHLPIVESEIVDTMKSKTISNLATWTENKVTGIVLTE